MIKCEHNEDTFMFSIQQEGYPKFIVPEGCMQLLVDDFLEPENIDPELTLWNTFLVTEVSGSLILERSSVTLLKMKKTDAKVWAAQIETTHGSVIRAYTK
jgi:hypothetical protein